MATKQQFCRNEPGLYDVTMFIYQCTPCLDAFSPPSSHGGSGWHGPFKRQCSSTNRGLSPSMLLGGEITSATPDGDRKKNVSPLPRLGCHTGGQTRPVLLQVMFPFTELGASESRESSFMVRWLNYPLAHPNS